MQKINSYLMLLMLLTGAVSCKESNTGKTPIILGDTALIVTENDANFLQNFTEDIAPARKRSVESEISTMMVQVDSLNTSKKMEAEAAGEETPAKMDGFTINFNECTVVFEGITAHALNETQNERQSQSVSYLVDAGQLLETKLEVNSLSDVKADERLFVKLSVEHNGEKIVLHELGKFLTQWFPLAGKNNRFVSVGANSLQFDRTDGAKIKSALEKELRKRKKNKEDFNAWMKAISKTASHNDAPCKLIPSGAQWRITGKVNGKAVRKLIQFDIPL